jgi:hypothetical protein
MELFFVVTDIVLAIFAFTGRLFGPPGSPVSGHNPQPGRVFHQETT